MCTWWLTSKGTDRKLWEEEWTELEGMCTRWPWPLTSTCIAPLSHSPPPPQPVPLAFSQQPANGSLSTPPPPPPLQQPEDETLPPSHCQSVAAASKQDNIGMITAWVSFKHHASTDITECLNNLYQDQCGAAKKKKKKKIERKKKTLFQNRNPYDIYEKERHSHCYATSQFY